MKKFLTTRLNVCSPGAALLACPRRVKPNSGELKLYVISPGWRVELLLSFQFSKRVFVCVRHGTRTRCSLMCTALHAYAV